MKSSPLQLDDALINQIRVEAHQGGTIQVVPPTGIELDVTPCYARHKTDPLQWIVKLHIEFKPGAGQPLSYSGDVDCEGFFTIADPALPETTQHKIIAVNAATMLYGTAREAVAAITARGRHGKLLLPSVSFIDETINPPEKENQTPMTDLETLRQQVKADPNRMFPEPDLPNLEQLAVAMGFTIEPTEVLLNKRGKQERQFKIRFASEA